MIPKIIHYCWFSDTMPEKVRRFIDAWRVVMPDYEFRLWNFDRFPRGKSQWVDQAFDAGKFAFAADYIRCYALYHEGGIYLDTDVEVLRPYDTLLALPYFLGLESTSGHIEAATMGAEAGKEIFKDILDFYDSHPFIRPDGTPDLKVIPLRLSEAAQVRHTVKKINSIEEFDRDPRVLCIFPSTWFSPIHLQNMRLEKSADTYSIHRFAASWQPRRGRLKKRVQQLLGPRVTDAVQWVKHRLLRL